MRMNKACQKIKVVDEKNISKYQKILEKAKINTSDYRFNYYSNQIELVAKEPIAKKIKNLIRTVSN